MTERQGFDPVDQLERYLRWADDGHLSSNGICFDIGNTVRDALMTFRDTREPYCGSTDPKSAGNGSLMRVAPVPLFFARTPVEAIDKSAESSRTTHGAVAAIDACRYHAALILGALQGAGKAELLAEKFSPVPDYWRERPLCGEIDEVARGSFKRREPPAITGSGYVVKGLEAALWAFNKSDTFRDGCLLAIHLGRDADTTGAIYGQLAGAFYGEGGIPDSWLAKLAHRRLVEDMAARLLSGHTP